jgi:Phage tail tube protein
MAEIATGIGKQVRVKAESTPGVFAGAASAQLMRRVTCGINLTKAGFSSNELNPDYQDSDFRHGARRVEGPLSGELSFGTYQTFFEAALRKAGAAVANITGLTLTVTASGSLFVVARGSGSWVTDGVRIGMVVRATAGLNANSLNKNMLVVGLTALNMTVLVLNGLSITLEAGVAACTVVVPGKNIIVPSTGHIDRSFSIEELNADLTTPISRTFLGCRVSTLGVRLPATGLSTVEFGFLGLDMTLAGAEAFTSPTAAGTSAIAAAVNGAVVLDQTPLAIVTGINYDINGGHTVEPVIGTDVSPDVFESKVRVSGQLTAFLQDDTLLDAFLNETELSLATVLLSGRTGAADFMSHFFGRIKINSASIDDGEKGLIVTAAFQALKKPTTTGFDSTTMMVHDSAYV